MPRNFKKNRVWQIEVANLPPIEGALSARRADDQGNGAPASSTVFSALSPANARGAGTADRVSRSRNGGVSLGGYFLIGTSYITACRISPCGAACSALVNARVFTPSTRHLLTVRVSASRKRFGLFVT